MKKIFVSKIVSGGIDWHDYKEIVTQLQYKANYEIPQDKINEVVAIDMINSFPYINKEDILNAINNKRVFKFQLIDKETNTPMEYSEAIFEGGTLTLFEDYMGGQISYTTNYEIDEIDEEDICYIVGEHFLSPWKGASLVERIYHEPFTSLDVAKRYLNELKIHETSNSFKNLTITSYKKIKSTEWFDLNMKAIKLMEEKNISPFDKTFAIYVKQHLQNLS